jgi:hypothetical protein
VPLKTELRQPPLLLENGSKTSKKWLRNPELPSKHNQVSEKEEADPKTSKRNKTKAHQRNPGTTSGFFLHIKFLRKNQ